jgi:hypothetical protein
MFRFFVKKLAHFLDHKLDYMIACMQVSLHSDVLNSQLLNLFRPFDGSGTGSPLTPRSPKVASPSGSSSLQRSRSMQPDRSPTPMRSPPGRLGPASPNKPQVIFARLYHKIFKRVLLYKFSRNVF